MRAGAAVIAVLMLLIGGVWIGQGLGYIKGSFMTGDMHWFFIGAILASLGVFLGAGAVWFRPGRKKTLP